MILTVEQLIEKYFNGCIGRTKVYDMVRKNEIPHLQLSSRKIYFNSNHIELWIEQGCPTQNKKIIEEYGKLKIL